MPVYALGEYVPDIDPEAFVHPDAVVIGQVSIGPEATIWPCVVLRGDYGAIRIGARTSIQDGTVIHATHHRDTIIGASCVVGHLAHLEGCVIEDDVLVGNASIVLHGAVVRSHALVGSNAVVTNGMEVPSGAMALGVPAVIKPGTVHAGRFAPIVEGYVQNGRLYRSSLRRVD